MEVRMIKNHNNIEELNKLFLSINKMGFVESKFKGSGAAGKTFESLIGKRGDSKCLPDFKGIEIKTHINNVKYPITLFSCMPDTNEVNSNYMLINFVKNCGHYGINNKNIYFNSKIYVNNICFSLNHFTKSYIDFKKQEIIIDFVSYDLELINKMAWPIKKIEKIIESKIKTLAIITVNRIQNEESTKFKYKSIEYYEYKGNKSFIESLKNRKIYISFNLNLQRINNKNKLKYHGISFVINIENISSLYRKILF